MDSKAMFESMMNIAKVQEEDGDIIKAAIENALSQLDVVALFRKPQIQRLLASDVMKEAIEASDIPLVQTLYHQFYNEAAEATTSRMAYDVTFFLTFALPVGLIIFLFVLLAGALLRRWKQREVTREEKKRLRQLKKENAEAQRRLQQAKRQ